MNTSNKILGVFFLLIFLVPVFVLLSFNSKIKRGDFTIVKNDQHENTNWRSGSFAPYKIIKVIGAPGRTLKCNLQYSDSLYYSYDTNGFQDSIRVYNVADTLFIQYINRTASKDNTDIYPINEIYIDVKLPVVEQLVVNNAEATLQPGNSAESNNLAVELYGKGVLNLGETGNDNDQATTNKTPFTIGQVSVQSTNGEVSFGSNITINQLVLHANGSSTVNIQEGAVITGVQGSLSDSSTVNASWKYVKKLAALTKD